MPDDRQPVDGVEKGQDGDERERRERRRGEAGRDE